MLVKSTVALFGKSRGTVFDVNGNDPEVRALVAKRRLVKVGKTDDLDALTGAPDGLGVVDLHDQE